MILGDVRAHDAVLSGASGELRIPRIPGPAGEPPLAEGFEPRSRTCTSSNSAPTRTAVLCGGPSTSFASTTRGPPASSTTACATKFGILSWFAFGLAAPVYALAAAGPPSAVRCAAVAGALTMSTEIALMLEFHQFGQRTRRGRVARDVQRAHLLLAPEA